MSPEFQRIISLVDAYLAGGDFMALWRLIDGPGAADLEPGPFAPREEAIFDELHNIVHMGQKDSATREEAGVGLLGGSELRVRLRQWRESALRMASI